MTDYSDFNAINDPIGVMILDLFLSFKKCVDGRVYSPMVVYLSEDEFNLIASCTEELRNFFERELEVKVSIITEMLFDDGIRAFHYYTDGRNGFNITLDSETDDDFSKERKKWNAINREQAKRRVLDEKLHRGIMSLLKGMEKYD